MGVKHVYHSLSGVNSRRQLAQLLHKSILYNKDGIIAINKPYGLRNGVGFDDPHDSKFKNVDKFDFNLSEVLPLLAKMVDVSELTVVRAPEKFASGVTLLKAKNDAGIKITKSIKHPSSPAVYTYQAVCCGTPLQVSYEGGRLGLKIQDEKKHIVTLTTDHTLNMLRKKKVKQIFYSHKVLSSNHDQEVSLVEVSTNRILWYYVPLYLAARLLTPVLGDQIHGNKVGYVFGKPVLLPQLQSTGFHPQKLPKDLYKQLELTDKDSMLIPNHLHLSSITLYYFSKKEPKHMTITAPPPAHFQWTCSQLKLWNEPEDMLPLELAA